MTLDSTSFTLIIRHLPSDLKQEEKIDLLKHFGAERVRCMSDRGRMKHTAFATFSTIENAEQAMSRLHQLEILGCRLIVEFAHHKDQKYFPHLENAPSFKQECEESSEKLVSEKEQIRMKMEDVSKKIHGIAPALGLDYLPSPLLKYKYPAPTPSIITNIAHALAAVPKFYTQVLHLMNKMHLPPPFGVLTPVPPLQPDIPQVLPQPTDIPVEKTKDWDVIEQEEMDVTSEEESEIESDEETSLKKTDQVAIKRTSRKKRHKIKKPKLQLLTPVLSNITSTMRTNPEDIFETPQLDSQGTKKIQFNIKPTLEPTSSENVDIFESSKAEMKVVGGGFGVIKPAKLPSDDETKDADDKDVWDREFITIAELQRNRISTKEMKSLSVYRRYSAGEPSSRLYIKNLAKQAEEKDLQFIFGRYVDRNSEEEKNMFDIRLMKEGRMKGQAFITLGNEKKAIQAVKETNGYLLLGKSLVVQFARSAHPKAPADKEANKKL